MSYQNDTTGKKVKALLEQRPTLEPTTFEMDAEFRDYLFQIATGTLMRSKGMTGEAAAKEAARRGVRLMMNERTGCLACGERSDFMVVFDDNTDARIIVYPLCETHTKMDGDQLDALVMEAQQNIYGDN